MVRSDNHAALDKNDWSFHTLESEEICACAHWEKARHRGDPRPPWLSLRPEERAELIVSKVFREIPPGYPAFVSTIVTSLPFIGTGQAVRAFIVEVDFSASDEALKEAFIRWVKAHPERIESQRRKPNKIPRHHPWRKWLLDIATYRVAKVYQNRKDALQVIWPLFEGWNVTRPNGRMSKEHWSAAISRAEKMATARRQPKVASGGKATKGNRMK